jgi:hypothetical protein
MTMLSLFSGSDPRTSDYLLTSTGAAHLVEKRRFVSVKGGLTADGRGKTQRASQASDGRDLE